MLRAREKNKLDVKRLTDKSSLLHEGIETGRRMPPFEPCFDNHADNNENMVLKIRYKEINHKKAVKKKRFDNLLERYVFIVFFREGGEIGTFCPQVGKFINKIIYNNMLCKNKFYFHKKCVIKISIIVVSFYACLPLLRRFFIFYNPIIIGLFRCFFSEKHRL